MERRKIKMKHGKTVKCKTRQNTRLKKIYIFSKTKIPL
jgi:hypothetical protein